MDGDEEPSSEYQHRLLSAYIGSTQPCAPWRRDTATQPVPFTQIPYLWKASIPEKWKHITNRPLQKIVGVYRERRDTLEFIIEKQRMMEVITRAPLRNTQKEWDKSTKKEGISITNKEEKRPKKPIVTRKPARPHSRSSSEGLLVTRQAKLYTPSRPSISPVPLVNAQLFSNLAAFPADTDPPYAPYPPSHPRNPNIDKFLTRLQAEQMQKRPRKAVDIPFQPYIRPTLRPPYRRYKRETKDLNPPTFHLRGFKEGKTERSSVRSESPREMWTQTKRESGDWKTEEI